MSHLIECHKIAEQNLLYHFEFATVEVSTGPKTGYQHFSADKWLTTINWISIYQKINVWVAGYASKGEITTSKTYDLEHTQFQFTLSWIKAKSSVGTSMKNLLKLDLEECCKHFLDIKVSLGAKSSLKAHIRELELKSKTLEDRVTELTNELNSKVLTSNLIEHASMDTGEIGNIKVELEEISETDLIASIQTELSSKLQLPTDDEFTSIPATPIKTEFPEMKIDPNPLSIGSGELIITSYGTDLSTHEEYIPNSVSPSPGKYLKYRPGNSGHKPLQQEYSPTSSAPTDCDPKYYPGGVQKPALPEYIPQEITLPSDNSTPLYSPSYAISVSSETTAASAENEKPSKNEKHEETAEQPDKRSRKRLFQGTSAKKKRKKHSRHSATPSDDSSDDDLITRTVKPKVPKVKEIQNQSPSMVATRRKRCRSVDLFGSDSGTETQLPARDDRESSSRKLIVNKSPVREQLSRKSKLIPALIEAEQQSSAKKPDKKPSESKARNTRAAQDNCTKTKRVGTPITKETQMMEKWLSKSTIDKNKEKSKKQKSPTRPSKSDKSKSSSSSSSSSALVSSTTVLPPPQKPLTDEEFKALQAKHEREMEAMQALRNMLKVEPLPHVEIVDLKHLTIDEIVESFGKHERHLHGFYKTFCTQKKGYKVHTPDDLPPLVLNHLLTDKQQLKMMAMLEDNYGDGAAESTSGFTDLFWDQILPEWCLAVFMDMYDFTRKEATERIGLQVKIAVNNFPMDESMNF